MVFPRGVRLDHMQKVPAVPDDQVLIERLAGGELVQVGGRPRSARVVVMVVELVGAVAGEPGVAPSVVGAQRRAGALARDDLVAGIVRGRRVPDAPLSP